MITHHTPVFRSRLRKQIELILSVISGGETSILAHASLHNVMRKIGNGVWSLNV